MQRNWVNSKKFWLIRKNAFLKSDKLFNSEKSFIKTSRVLMNQANPLSDCNHRYKKVLIVTKKYFLNCSLLELASRNLVSTKRIILQLCNAVPISRLILKNKYEKNHEISKILTIMGIEIWTKIIILVVNKKFSKF